MVLKQGQAYARLIEGVPLVDIGKERLLRRKIRRFIGHIEKEFEELPTFGPVYSAYEAPIFKGYKEKAWNHVLEKSTGGGKLETSTNGKKLEIPENLRGDNKLKPIESLRGDKNLEITENSGGDKKLEITENSGGDKKLEATKNWRDEKKLVTIENWRDEKKLETTENWRDEKKLKTTENWRDEKELETIENYLSAIREVEKEAIDCYVDVTTVESVTEFRWMMLKDGCFLLQLVILILGGSPSKKNPEADDVIFGGSKRKEMKRWLKSMFYVGNQIPLVILWKLMEQPFFQKLVDAREWKEEPSSLPKRVLYELLLVPYIRKRNFSWQIKFPTTLKLGAIYCGNSQLPGERHSDLLHGLHSFVINGTRKNPTKRKGEDIDLELGDVEDDAVEDKGFSRATKLFQTGIRFKNVKGMGFRGIYFQWGISSPVLFMPTLTVDADTELMFKYLKDYEKTQQPNNSRKQEVCTYLKFMSELVQTPEDVKILVSQGIIKGDAMYKEKLPRILGRMADGESSKNLFRLRLQIDEYSQPVWLKYKGILSTAFLLTVLQTVFTILSYIRDVNKS